MTSERPMNGRPGANRPGPSHHPTGDNGSAGGSGRPERPSAVLGAGQFGELERDLDAVADWLSALIDQAPDGVLPLLGTAGWAGAEPVTRWASLACWALARLYEDHPQVIAARLAAEIAAGRRAHLAAMKQAAVAVSAGHDWHGLAVAPTRAEILRRRNHYPTEGRTA